MISDDANGKVDGQKITWTVDVPAGESKIININCKINESAAGKVVNTVKITPDNDIEIEEQGEEDEQLITIKPNDSSSSGGGDKEKTTQQTIKKIKAGAKTGDDMNMMTVIVIMILAAGVVAITGYRRYQAKKN